MASPFLMKLACVLGYLYNYSFKGFSVLIFEIARVAPGYFGKTYFFIGDFLPIFAIFNASFDKTLKN